MLKPSKPDLLSQLAGFIGRYLQCSEHQRTILALWILYTYTFSAAQVTAYLSIQSAYKQSGKTLCLQLLGLLCENPSLTSGFTADSLTFRMRHKPLSTVLLDECQATVGTRSRSKAPALRALLASSFHRSLNYTRAVQDATVFCPKAFAGKGQLPEELADRSLPIILEPLGVPTFLGYDYDLEEVLGAKPPASRSYVEQPPSAAWGTFGPPQEILNNHAVCNTTPQNHQQKSEAVNHSFFLPQVPDGRGSPVPCFLSVLRFHLSQATREAQPLKELLSAWAKDHLPHLKELPPYSPDDFPPNLSPRRQDLCEPLLQLADALGDPWPERARQALIAVFAQEAAFDLQPALQLLADVRHCFQFHSFPERLSTSTLMDWMRTLPARPWDADGPLTPRAFARLLLAFDVRPRLQRLGQEGPARGYQLHDFMEPWRRHLGAMPIHKFRPALPPDFRHSTDSRKPEPSAAPNGVGAKTESQGQKSGIPDSEIAKNDGLCNTIVEFCATNGTRPQNGTESPR